MKLCPEVEEDIKEHPVRRKKKNFADDLHDLNNNLKTSLQKPELTSLGRLMGFNKIQVGRFFDLLRDMKLKYKFGPGRISNGDENDLSMVPSKQPIVLFPTVCSINAQGTCAPPYIIFPRVQMRPELLNGCPPGSDAIAHPSGWIKYFIKFTHPSEENPILLIADNHSSHCSLDTINVCRSNSIQTY
ncbi:hypothetical protein ILUMI_15710 [Ignelater luminosus]|uniref:DDE-1 domain-containing protein n=1 Tax=Ignelater luminosus TaxID=2038154 RepID=A0A8K0CTL0_IGNLU|nr:hypothetical protein ILUMI_15710 [Ignelater luminosus]